MADFSICNIIIIISLNILVFPNDISTLKLVGVHVPELVPKGGVTTLRCEYELEGDRLYSVLWYKDHEEFYRFVPRNEPKQHSYKLGGFRVEIHKSDERQVLLRNINLRASGVYRCEVSAEAPSFTSVHGEGRMEVIAFPKEDPEITGDRRIYQVGDSLRLNCTSGKSYPSAKLKLFVNNIQVDPDYEAVYQHHGLITSVVGINFELQSEHFKDGQIVVRCVSTIHNKEPVLDDQIISPIDIRETMFLVEAQGSIARISKWVITVVLLSLLT